MLHLRPASIRRSTPQHEPEGSVPLYPYPFAQSGWRLKRLQHPTRDIGGPFPRSEDGSKDVLVVEDEAYLCDLIADVLEADGHRARKASNGLEALARLRERTPDLILLDLMMPIMDGWEFMSALKANKAWSDLPVVIITAIYDIKRTQQQTGARAVITKPFDIDQIGDIVRSFAN